jgi:hypothetical protein
MNDHELESLLRELPDPVLPADWRGPVLAVARREARKDSRAGANWPAVLLTFFRLFQRNPITVGGLTILWTLVLVLKAETPVDHDAERMMARAGSTPPVPYFIPLREEVLLAQVLDDESGPQPMRQP